MRLTQETFKIDYTLNGEAKHLFVTTGDEMTAVNIFYYRFISDEIFSRIPLKPNLQKVDPKDVYKLISVNTRDAEKIEDIINLYEKRNHKIYKVDYEYFIPEQKDPIIGCRYVLASDSKRAQSIFENREFIKRYKVTDVTLEEPENTDEALLIHLGHEIN